MKAIAILIGLSCALVGSPIPDFPFIYVRGYASEEIPTTLASIRFDLVKHSRISADGEKALSEASKATRQALRDLGVKDEDFDASNIDKREEFGEFPKSLKKEDPADSVIPKLPQIDEPDESVETKNKEIYFSFRQRFYLKITDLKLYPDLARHLMQSSDVSQYDVNFFATNRDEVIRKLRIAAFADAKRAAKEIADTSGETLGRVHSVSEMPYSDLGYLVGESSGIDMASGEFHSGEIYEVPPTISESFNIIVLFRLEQPETPKSESGPGE